MAGGAHLPLRQERTGAGKPAPLEMGDAGKVVVARHAGLLLPFTTLGPTVGRVTVVAPAPLLPPHRTPEPGRGDAALSAASGPGAPLDRHGCCLGGRRARFGFTLVCGAAVRQPRLASWQSAGAIKPPLRLPHLPG